VASIALLPIALLAPHIGWEGPASCPDRAAAQASLDRLLKDSPTPADDPGARVRITAQGDRFVARVQLGATGERTIEGDTCTPLADAALLIVAMAIDPRLGGAPQPPPTEIPEPEAVPEPESVPSPKDPPKDPPNAGAPPVSPPPRTPRQPPKVLLRASAGVGVGGPPPVAGVIAIGIATHWPRARIELDADLWTPRTREAPADPRVGVQVLGWTIGLRGCGSPIAKRFELPLCGGIRTGALRGRGTGPLTSSAASSIWVTATAGLGAWGWIRPRFALALDVEAVVALTAPQFRLDPAGDVFTAFPAGLRAVFGPVVRLP